MVAGDLREEGVGSCSVDTELVGSGEDGEVWRWKEVFKLKSFLLSNIS